MLQSILSASVVSVVSISFVLFAIAFVTFVSNGGKKVQSVQSVQSVQPKLQFASQTMHKPVIVSIPLEGAVKEILDRKPTMEELRNTAKDLHIKGWNLPNIKYETLERKINETLGGNS